MARYTVREDKIPPQLRARFFRAWINDAKHPDDPTEGASCAWFTDLADAHRVCDALNVSDRITRAQIETDKFIERCGV